MKFVDLGLELLVFFHDDHFDRLPLFVHTHFEINLQLVYLFAEFFVSGRLIFPFFTVIECLIRDVVKDIF